MLAVEQNKVLIPSFYNKYLAWGFSDMSIRIGNYDSDRVRHLRGYNLLHCWSTGLVILVFIPHMFLCVIVLYLWWSCIVSCRRLPSLRTWTMVKFSALLALMLSVWWRPALALWWTCGSLGRVGVAAACSPSNSLSMATRSPSRVWPRHQRTTWYCRGRGTGRVSSGISVVWCL